MRVLKCGRLSKSCILSFGVLLATVTAGLSQGRPTYKISEMLVGRPANFYEIAFGMQNDVCVITLDALNKPAAMPPQLRFPDDYARIDVSFFLRNGYSVSWEPRALISETQLLGQPITRVEMGRSDSVVIDLFGGAASVEVVRLLLSLHNVLRHDTLVMSPSSSNSQNSETGLVDGLRPFHRRLQGGSAAEIEMRFQTITVVGGHRSNVDADQKKRFDALGTSFGLIVESGREVYTYRDLVSIQGVSYWLVMPARAPVFADMYKTGIPIYLLKSKTHFDHELLCEFKGRYAEVGG